MARAYAKLYVSVWDQDSDFLDLTPDAQWLYLVLISHPLLSPAGVLPLQPRKWARRAKGMTYKRVAAALAELIDTNSKVLVDEDTEEVLIRTFIRHDRGWKTPNIKKSIMASIDRIESHRLRVRATHELTQAETLGETHSGRDEPKNSTSTSNRRPTDLQPPEQSLHTQDHSLGLTPDEAEKGYAEARKAAGW